MKKLLIFLLLFLLPIPSLAEQTVKITFVGDCTIGGEDRVRESEVSFDAYLKKYGYTYFFQEVQSIIGQDDLTVANLESVLRDNVHGKVEKTYNFRGDKHFVNVLTKSSIEAVNLANNHTFDYGNSGVRDTAETLDNAGLPWFGTGYAMAQTWIYEKENIKIGFIGTEIPYWGRGDRNLLAQQMRDLRTDGCQVVIAVMHGGTEYDRRRDASQRNCADFLLNHGADIIIGHHPHVLQGIDVKDGKTICYSIGNFVFGGNAKVRSPYTALFQFSLQFADDGTYQGHQLTIFPAMPSGDMQDNNYQPVLASGEDAQKAMYLIQYDTQFSLNAYEEGKGAVQDFVPAQP